MKLKFKQQDFQTDAVNAVCALFDGQQRQTTTFSMEQSGGQVGLFANVGVANALCISDEQIIGNMQAVQQKNLLPKTEDLQGRQFSVEMETGTGKTYVYTKTVYELNRLYGFTKFIVVVPSFSAFLKIRLPFLSTPATLGSDDLYVSFPFPVFTTALSGTAFVV